MNFVNLLGRKIEFCECISGNNHKLRQLVNEKNCKFCRSDEGKYREICQSVVYKNREFCQCISGKNREFRQLVVGKKFQILSLDKTKSLNYVFWQGRKIGKV